MTPNEIALLRSSFGRVFAARRSLGRVFYDKLFEAAPSLRPLFAEDISRQQERFDDMIGLVVKEANRPDALREVLVQLGRRHRGYGAASAHLATVGAVLVNALRDATPGGLSDGETAAWVSAWALVSGVVAEGLGEGSAQDDLVRADVAEDIPRLLIEEIEIEEAVREPTGAVREDVHLG